MKDALGHGSNADLGAAIKAYRANSPFGHGVVPVSGGEPHGPVATAAKQLADVAKNGTAGSIARGFEMRQAGDGGHVPNFKPAAKTFGKRNPMNHSWAGF